MSQDRVTLRDIQSAINRLEDKLGKRLDKMETDVDTLKANQNKSLGVLGVIMIFSSAASTYIWNRLTGT